MLITCPKCSAQYQVPDEVELLPGRKLQCSECKFVFKFQPVIQEEKQEKVALVPPEDAVLTTVSYSEKTVSIEKKQSVPTESSFPEVFCPVPAEDKKGILSYLILFICFCFIALLSVVGWYYRDLLFMETNFFRFDTKEYQRPLRKMTPKRRSVPVSRPKVVLPAQEQDFPEVKSIEAETMPSVPSPERDSLVIQNSRFRVTSQADISAVLIEGILYNSSDQDIPLPEKLYATAYEKEGRILFKKEIYLPQGMLKAHQEQAFFGTYTSAPGRVQWIDVSLRP